MDADGFGVHRTQRTYVGPESAVQDRDAGRHAPRFGIAFAIAPGNCDT